MTLYEVPKEKKNFLDGEVVIHVSGFGIYPDIYELEQAATGDDKLLEIYFKLFFFNPGPERSVIKWFLDKKMVITAFRKVNIELHKLDSHRFLTKCVFDLKLLQVEAGNQVCLVEEQPKEPKPKAQANDMITFRSLSLFKTRFY